MTTAFDERERAFEAKFVHDAELQFKVEARARNRLALWAAGRMGRSGEAAVAYARAVLADWLGPTGGDAVARVLADLAASGAAASGTEARARLEDFRAEAKRQVMDEA